MIQSYLFSEQYEPAPALGMSASLRLLEGGKFSPGDFAPVLLTEEDTVRLKYLQWGFYPACSPVAPLPNLLPAERIAEVQATSAWRPVFCLVPAHAFHIQGAEHPLHPTWRLSGKSQQPLTLVGLVRVFQEDHGAVRPYFSLLTLPAPPSLLPIARRTPLVLPAPVHHPMLLGQPNLPKVFRASMDYAEQTLFPQRVEELKEDFVPDRYPSVRSAA